ncbi:MAG: zinc dependent phospholipase C family protein, partial [Candidatus Hodarchaeota archaeon]
INVLYKFYKNIEEVVDIYNRVVGPIRQIKDEVGDAMEQTVETLAPSSVELIRQLIDELKETASLFKSTLATGLFAGVVEGFNFLTDTANLPSVTGTLFQTFKPPMQDNAPVSDWYWYDMLHYRKTGDFARSLVDLADTPRKRAFTHGYLSHIASDVVGHGFVNQVVGGPYRLNVQRHATVENYMDSWKFNQHYEENINFTLFSRLGLPSSLPAEIGDLLDQAFRQTYTGATHPTRLSGDGFLSRQQIDQTYEVFYKVVELMAKSVVARPEEPFSNALDVLEQAFRDLFEAPPDAPESSSEACGLGDIFSFGLTESSRDCYENFFEEVGEWLEYLGELIVWAFETLMDMFDLLLTLLLSLPVMVLLAILYGLQLLLYEIYQASRSILALNGLVTPNPDDLRTSHGRNLTTTFQGCGLSSPLVAAEYRLYTRAASVVSEYPRRRSLTTSHLVCPKGGSELPITVADFNPADDDVTPDQFIINLPLNSEAIGSYSQAQTPLITHELYGALSRIGSAVDFTKWMIANANVPENRDAVFTNWNLDSDRGYGYKSWTGTIDSDGAENVEYTDD